MILDDMIGGEMINFIGGTVRWCLAMLYKPLTKDTKKYTFKEYLYGPKKSQDWFDKRGHELNNRILGLLVIVGVSIWIVKLVR
jgi:hypothetical protein